MPFGRTATIDLIPFESIPITEVSVADVPRGMTSPCPTGPRLATHPRIHEIQRLLLRCGQPMDPKDPSSPKITLEQIVRSFSRGEPGSATFFNIPMLSNYRSQHLKPTIDLALRDMDHDNSALVKGNLQWLFNEVRTSAIEAREERRARRRYRDKLLAARHSRKDPNDASELAAAAADIPTADEHLAYLELHRKTIETANAVLGLGQPAAAPMTINFAAVLGLPKAPGMGLPAPKAEPSFAQELVARSVEGDED